MIPRVATPPWKIDLKMAGVPVKMSATPGAVEKPAPMLGQHTAEILKELFGWDEEKTKRFFTQN